MLLDDQPLLARFVVLYDARGAVPERRIHVAVPQIERFENVTVGIDNVVSAGHWSLRGTKVNLR